MKFIWILMIVICFLSCEKSNKSQNQEAEIEKTAFVMTASVSNQSPVKKFVRTTYKCKKCNCRGYHGIKHDAGTYEGRCSNSDGTGHSCKHSPSDHGLRNY